MVTNRQKRRNEIVQRNINCVARYDDSLEIMCPECRENITGILRICSTDEHLLPRYEMLEPEYCPYCGTHLDWKHIVIIERLDTIS